MYYIVVRGYGKGSSTPTAKFVGTFFVVLGQSTEISNISTKNLKVRIADIPVSNNCHHEALGVEQ